MTPEKQRIAIAEACGLEVLKVANPADPDAWKRGYFTPSAARTRRKGWRSGGVVKIIPDYLDSLDAMHEAVKKLPDGHTYWRYIELLDGLVKHGGHVDHVADRATATAEQQAKAFLHALNLWVEE
jgi:hypothetical protein